MKHANLTLEIPRSKTTLLKILARKPFARQALGCDRYDTIGDFEKAMESIVHYPLPQTAVVIKLRELSETRHEPTEE
jgi:hypothetical protein